VLLSTTAKKLEALGVKTLGVMATTPDKARLFFRFRPPRIRIGCDPDLRTHRAYGVPNVAVTPEMWQAVEVAAVNELRGMGQPEVPVVEAYDTLGKLDGYTPTEDDMADFERHRAQLTGQFLMDRDGVVRWAHVEDEVDQVPSDEELLAAARVL
jgi:alkyl-hydroperoxide reductase/thiol specific antioxidant family protein